MKAVACAGRCPGHRSGVRRTWRCCSASQGLARAPFSLFLQEQYFTVSGPILLVVATTRHGLISPRAPSEVAFFRLNANLVNFALCDGTFGNWPGRDPNPTHGTLEMIRTVGVFGFAGAVVYHYFPVFTQHPRLLISGCVPTPFPVLNTTRLAVRTRPAYNSPSSTRWWVGNGKVRILLLHHHAQHAQGIPPPRARRHGPPPAASTFSVSGPARSSPSPPLLNQNYLSGERTLIYATCRKVLHSVAGNTLLQ